MADYAYNIPYSVGPALVGEQFQPTVLTVSPPQYFNQYRGYTGPSPETSALAMALQQQMLDTIMKQRGGGGRTAGGGTATQSKPTSTAQVAPPMQVSHTPFVPTPVAPTAQVVPPMQASHTPSALMQASHTPVTPGEVPLNPLLSRQYVWSAPTDSWSNYLNFQMQNLNPIELYQRAIGRPFTDFVAPWLWDEAVPFTGESLYEAFIDPWTR